MDSFRCYLCKWIFGQMAHLFTYIVFPWQNTINANEIFNMRVCVCEVCTWVNRLRTSLIYDCDGRALDGPHLHFVQFSRFRLSNAWNIFHFSLWFGHISPRMSHNKCGVYFLLIYWRFVVDKQQTLLFIGWWNMYFRANWVQNNLIWSMAKENVLNDNFDS